MDLRELTGYVAHVLLAAYWLWVIVSTAPQLRKGTRDRGVRVRSAMVRTAVLVVLFLAVGVIHFWGTEWWHIVGAILVTGVLVLLLRRAYRRLVAPSQHRITLRQRVLGREVAIPAPRTGDGGTDPERRRHRHRRSAPGL